MEKFRAVLLNVRREACHHIEISESTERIAATLTRDIPIDRALAALRSARVSDSAETPTEGLTRVAHCKLERVTFERSTHIPITRCRRSFA